MSKIIEVETGEIKVARGETILRSNAIGSCVVVAAYDSTKKVGAIAHVMLPGSAPKEGAPQRTKYAADAIDVMLEELGRLGSNKESIEVYLVGGGNVLEDGDDTISQDNIASVVELLNTKGIRIRSEALGGTSRRSVSLDIEKGLISYSEGNGHERDIAKDAGKDRATSIMISPALRTGGRTNDLETKKQSKPVQISPGMETDRVKIEELKEAQRASLEIMEDMKQGKKELEESRAASLNIMEDLDDARAYVDNIIKSMIDALIVIEPDATIRTVNRATCDLLGYAEGELLGKPAAIIFEEESIFSGLRLKKLIQEGTVRDHDMKYRTKTGELIPVSFSGSVMRHSEGALLGIVGIARDMREIKRLMQREKELAVSAAAAQAARANEDSLKEAQAFAHTGSWDLNVVDGDLKWSDETYRIFGFKPQEFVPTREAFEKVLHPEDRERVNQAVKAALRGDQDYRIENRIVRPDGQVRWVYSTGEVTRDSEGHAIRFHGIQMDITERKQSEAEMRMHSEIVKNMFEGIYLTRADDGVILETNPRFEKMFGYGPGEMIGKHVSIVNASSEKDALETAREMMSVLDKTGEWHGVVHNVKKDGTPFWCYANISVLDHSEHGKVLVAVHEDITERKKAKEELENIFDLSADMICVCTAEGIFVKINPACEKILGYKQDEILALGWAALVHPDDVEMTNKEVEKQLKGGSVINFVNRFRCKDGTYKILEWQATPSQDGLVYATARDITERKKAEEKHQKDLELNKILLDSLPHPAMLISKDRRIVVMNKVARDAGVILGSFCWETFKKCQYIPEKNAEEFQRTGKVLAGSSCSFCRADQCLQNKDVQNDPEVFTFGRTWDMYWIGIDSNLYLHYTIDITERKNMQEAKLEAEKQAIKDIVITYQHYISQPLTAAYAHLNTILESPSEDKEDKHSEVLRKIKDDLGRMSMLLKKLRSIDKIDRIPYFGDTAMISLEQEQEQFPAVLLEQVGRMVALGEFTAALAHQISHPLTAISAYLDTLLLDETIASNVALRNKTESIRKEIRRLGLAVKRIGDYLRQQSSEMRPEDLNRTMEDSLSLFGQQFEDYNIEFASTLDRNTPRISIEKSRIQDVMVNLLVNARDAIEMRYQQEPGGRVELFTRLIKSEEALVAGIIDNGVPVAQGTEDKIFDIFFTTKGAGEGTGLGLAVCRDVLRRHHGLLGFVKLRDGTKAFYFALPLRSDRDLTGRSQAIAEKIASVLVAGKVV